MEMFCEIEKSLLVKFFAKSSLSLGHFPERHSEKLTFEENRLSMFPRNTL